MPRATLIVIAALASLCMLATAHAEGGYRPPSEMIRLSEFIAIVTIERVTPLPKPERPRWQFGERARATVERNVKGALPRAIDIYGDENFVCQQTQLSAGRYLVFLTRGIDGRLQSVNYQMGVRPIRGASVEWYYRGGDPLGPLYGYQLRWQPLDPLLRHIGSTPRPNQAMQLTASKPAIYAFTACRRARMLRGMPRGLAAADLVSR
jgi:hypothetical protein